MTDGPVLSIGHSPAGDWDLAFPASETRAVPIEIIAQQRPSRPPVVFRAGCVPCENFSGQRILTGIDRLADGTIEVADGRYSRTNALRLIAMILTALNAGEINEKVG
jgi:hypothetical protein